MNLLFEIPDSVLIIIGIIIVLIIAIISIIIKASSRKIKPIDETERYDNDEIEVEEISNENLTDDQKKAKMEIEKVFEQMNSDLEKQKEEVNDIDDFERQQEENAIISYQELLAHAEKLKEEAAKYEEIAEKKANTKIKDAINKKDTLNIEQKKKAFKSSEIVSPIYGIQSNKNMIRQKKSPKKQNSGIINKSYEQERFENEKTQNLDFLNSLKEFRKNL